MTIWRMRSSCWIPKPTNTHSEYVIRNDFLLQQWLHECLNVTLYVHRLSCYIINAQVLFIFLIKNKNSVHPYVTILKVFAVHIAVLAFPLCPKLVL